MRRAARDAALIAELRAELAAHRAAQAALLDVVERAAAGDLEARVPSQGDDPSHAALRDRVNDFLDVVDAFVRESQAALTAAADGRYHRHFLEQGMPGAFREGARRIDAGRASMETAAQRLADQVEARSEFAESAVASSAQVTVDLEEVAIATATLAASMAAAVREARAALRTVRQLEEHSAATAQTVGIIGNVADQTRMLALNATIEASRAGDAGRGFAVVAHEVRTLADETARSATGIGNQTVASIGAAADAAAAIDRIARLVEEMDGQVGAIAMATGDSSNLAWMARSLREQIGTFTG